MLRITHILRPQEAGSSAWSVFSIILGVWAAISVLGAISAAASFARLHNFSTVDVLTASLPYLVGLVALSILFFVLARGRSPFLRASQTTKLAIVLELVAAFTAWLMLAYAAVLGQFPPFS